MLPTSYRFLDGMEWLAMEDWHNPYNNPDMPERMIFVICARSVLSPAGP